MTFTVSYDPHTLKPDDGLNYEFDYNSNMPWTSTKPAAENSTYTGASGHVVTITTANENTLVDNLVPDESHSWIGLSDETTEGQHKWVTDDSYDYTNWNTAQPSTGTVEDLSLIHIPEPTTLRRTSYPVFCLKQKKV